MDADNAAILGFSMGGTGAVNACGAGFAVPSLYLMAQLAGLKLPAAEGTGADGSISTPHPIVAGPLSDWSSVRSEWGQYQARVARVTNRVKALMLFAPWGRAVGGGISLWDTVESAADSTESTEKSSKEGLADEHGLRGLAGVHVPTMFVCGSADGTSGYGVGDTPWKVKAK